MKFLLWRTLDWSTELFACSERKTATIFTRDLSDYLPPYELRRFPLVEKFPRRLFPVGCHRDIMLEQNARREAEGEEEEIRVIWRVRVLSVYFFPGFYPDNEARGYRAFCQMNVRNAIVRQYVLPSFGSNSCIYLAAHVKTRSVNLIPSAPSIRAVKCRSDGPKYEKSKGKKKSGTQYTGCRRSCDRNFTWRDLETTIPYWKCRGIIYNDFSVFNKAYLCN